ncbi:hypothetical protein PG996_004114 [Apiospora saccharicola]|uniref:2EXR domain-containing protein n=1 Tax=Apiospora saccharicola TaxID=335842 RepID=A0ABR1W6Z2_9PEZI
MFHSFPKLPPELRHMIWTYAVEEPHVVHARGLFDRAVLEGLKRRNPDGGDTPVAASPAIMLSTPVYPKFPPVHNVCREARRVFLESPGLVLPEAPSATELGVAWHPERDFVLYHSVGPRAMLARLAACRAEGGDKNNAEAESWKETLDMNRLWKSIHAWQYSIPGRESVRNIMFDLWDFNDGYAGYYSTRPFAFYICIGSVVSWDLHYQFPRADTMLLVYKSGVVPRGKPEAKDMALGQLRGSVSLEYIGIPVRKVEAEVDRDSSDEDTDLDSIICRRHYLRGGKRRWWG